MAFVPEVLPYHELIGRGSRPPSTSSGIHPDRRASGRRDRCHVRRLLRTAGREVLEDHWRGSPEALERLLRLAG
jgi:hypothetical protein